MELSCKLCKNFPLCISGKSWPLGLTLLQHANDYFYCAWFQSQLHLEFNFRCNMREIPSYLCVVPVCEILDEYIESIVTRDEAQNTIGRHPVQIYTFFDRHFNTKKILDVSKKCHHHLKHQKNCHESRRFVWLISLDKMAKSYRVVIISIWFWSLQFCHEKRRS